MPKADEDGPAGVLREEGARAAASSIADYEHLRRLLARSVGRVCPAWLADAREDIIQSALVRVLEAQKKSEQERVPPASYLWKVAYTATVDEIRRIRRRQDEPLDEATLEEAGRVADSDPHRDRLMQELGEAIRRCLERLNDPRRLVVGLFLLGDDLLELERLTGWGGKKVRNLLYRGLAAMRRCLAAKGIHP